MFHKFTAFGYITKHPEVKVTTSGNVIIRLPFATSTKIKGINNDIKEEVLYIDIIVYGKATEQHDAKKFTKGMPLFVEGRLKIKTFDDVGKISQKKIVLIADEIHFVNVKNEVFFQELEIPEIEEELIEEMA